MTTLIRILQKNEQYVYILATSIQVYSEKGFYAVEFALGLCITIIIGEMKCTKKNQVSLAIDGSFSLIRQQAGQKIKWIIHTFDKRKIPNIHNQEKSIIRFTSDFSILR